jgi:hypothetical protein
LQQLEGDLRLNNQMKKAFSILFALLVLLSGIHLSVATHTCGGEFAAVKYSITGEKATCGMEEDQNPAPLHGAFKSDCCKNNVASCSADYNYFPSFTEYKAFTGDTAPVLSPLPDFFISTPILSKTYYSLVGPPVSKNYSSVDQSFICVFII